MASILGMRWLLRMDTVSLVIERRLWSFTKVGQSRFLVYR